MSEEVITRIGQCLKSCEVKSLESLSKLTGCAGDELRGLLATPVREGRIECLVPHGEGYAADDAVFYRWRRETDSSYLQHEALQVRRVQQRVPRGSKDPVISPADILLGHSLA